MWLWKVFAGLLFLWIILALLGGATSGLYFGSNETNIISVLMAPQTPAYTNPVGGITATFSVTQQYMSVLWQAMWLDFPMFQGEYAIVRILFLVIIIGVVVALVVGAIKPY